MFLRLFVKYYTDAVILSLVLGCTLLYTYYFVNLSIHPFEDAAMVMRYASNFAKTGEIVWNIGEAPVDGATDFLFTLILGLVIKTGISMEIATRGLEYASHLLTIVVIYYTLRNTLHLPKMISVLPTIYFAIGPGLSHVAAYFGTPFFVLFTTLSWSLVTKIITHETSNDGERSLFAFSTIVMSLIRPEGAILSGLMLLTIINCLGFRKSWPVIIRFLIVFALIGGAYFIWRWLYFGYPLPNPYYKKGGGNLHISGLINSVKNVYMLSWPYLVLYVLSLKSQKTTKMMLSLLIPVIGFTLVFILISDEMNFGARFQHPLLPIVLTSVFVPIKTIFSEQIRPYFVKLLASFLFLIAGLLAILYQHDISRHMTYFRDGRYDVAIILREYASSGYLLATSEAGILPLYSGWKSIDTWGLNDQWIAHNGGITEAYLDKKMPDIVMYHAFFSPQVKESPLVASLASKGSWHSMNRVLDRWCRKNKYTLVASFGKSPNDTHYYYLKTNFKDAKKIRERILSTRYLWFEDGKTANIY